MKSVYADKYNCCGCTACENICPTKAIDMKVDNEGFKYPQIDEIKCIDCGLCKEVCAFQNGCNIKARLDRISIFAIKHRDDNIRMKSRSGGLFTAISDIVLNKGGLVYGAGYRKTFEVCHKVATNKDQRDEFRGSKYVQSDLKGVFLDIEEKLKANKLVLFTGTPCQTAGLNAYLEKTKVEKETLFLSDVVCRGVPSPMVWKDFLVYKERKHHGKVEKVDFRNKELFGWRAHRETVVINNKIYDSIIYTELFYESRIIRPSCYNCKYTNMVRPSDITLADFWGVDDFLKGFDDDKGISLAIVNTLKGQNLLDKAKDSLIVMDCTGVELPHKNLKRPIIEPSRRKEFWVRYHQKGFAYEAKRVKIRRIKKKIRIGLGRVFKNVFKQKIKPCGSQ